MATQPLLQSNVPGFPCRHGKVRDVYDLGDRLVIVATDRISAFDWVLPTGIPDKGRVLTGMTLFWLRYLKTPNHFLSTDLNEMGPAFAARADELQGRTMLVRKTAVVPVACGVRGYLVGSGILSEEVLTRDSSRFWPADQYRPGANPPSFDKQFVRDWLETTGWDKNSQPPELPAEVVARTRAKYLEAYQQLTGSAL